MHLKLLILVSLVALGTAARQSWKNSRSEENGEKRLKKASDYAMGSSGLNKKYGNSLNNDLFSRKEVRRVKYPKRENVLPNLSDYLELESGRPGTKTEPPNFDVDNASTQIRETVSEDTFSKAIPLHPMSSVSYPQKRNFEESKKSSRPAQDWRNEELLGHDGADYGQMYKEIDAIIEKFQVGSRESHKSSPTKSDVGANDQTEIRGAEVRSTTDSEKASVKLSDHLDRNSCKPPSMKAETRTKTDNYLRAKNELKDSPIMTRLNPLKSTLELFENRLIVVEKAISKEISDMKEKLLKMEEKLSDIELLLYIELDETAY